MPRSHMRPDGLMCICNLEELRVSWEGDRESPKVDSIIIWGCAFMNKRHSNKNKVEGEGEV